MFNWDDWNTHGNSSIRVCLPDLCSFYLPAGCRGIGESLVGGIDVKMAFHRQRWNANTIVQHSILCLLPIRKFQELIGKYSDEVQKPDLCIAMLQGSVGIPFFLWLFSASEVLFALGSPVSKIYRIQHTQECRFSMNSQLDGVSSCINVDYMRFVQNCVDESRHAVIMHISDLH